MSTDQILERYAITTAVGHQVIPPGVGATAKAIAAVESSNSTGRLVGLADDLNPTLLDVEKVQGFLSGLPKLPSTTLEKLRGRTFFVNDSKLQLQSYTPINPSTLAQGYTLHIDDSDGEYVRARLDAPMDFKLARDRATRAKQAMEDADLQVATLEKQKQQIAADSSVYVAHSTAERRRYAAALVWRNLCTVLAEHYPENRDLQAEAAHAKQMAARYWVGAWTGMP